jgi:hypothetical protein
VAAARSGGVASEKNAPPLEFQLFDTVNSTKQLPRQWSLLLGN